MSVTFVVGLSIRRFEIQETFVVTDSFALFCIQVCFSLYIFLRKLLVWGGEEKREKKYWLQSVSRLRMDPDIISKRAHDAFVQ